ncbi:MAG: hypothetical protein HY901_09245 [Deltaproteobacteria bacterium]|nr:hypothetical protein [Deltaproteobacteria bacterium]
MWPPVQLALLGFALAAAAPAPKIHPAPAAAPVRPTTPAEPEQPPPTSMPAVAPPPGAQPELDPFIQAEKRCDRLKDDVGDESGCRARVRAAWSRTQPEVMKRVLGAQVCLLRGRIPEIRRELEKAKREPVPDRRYVRYQKRLLRNGERLLKMAEEQTSSRKLRLAPCDDPVVRTLKTCAEAVFLDVVSAELYGACGPDYETFVLLFR